MFWGEFIKLFVSCLGCKNNTIYCQTRWFFVRKWTKKQQKTQTTKIVKLLLVTKEFLQRIS